jgi:hypothetical protein
MKTQNKTSTSSVQTKAKSMTLGDLIFCTYSACGEQQAPKILQLAMDTHLVRLKGSPSLG